MERATVAVFGVLACVFGVLLAWMVMAVGVGTDDKGKTGASAEKIKIIRVFQFSPLRHRIPTASEAPEWAQGEGGLLLAYGQDYDWGLARGAEYVDKILRGAKPSDLPVVQATKLC